MEELLKRIEDLVKKIRETGPGAKRDELMFTLEDTVMTLTEDYID